jgi:O-antigen/teichoic acid export membrane protein
VSSEASKPHSRLGPSLEGVTTNTPLRRLYRNVGVIFSGHVVAGLVGLMVWAILTRALPLEQVGLYALVTAYITLIDRLTSFQTWQALIHFGAHARDRGDTAQLTNLFAFGWFLDGITGVLGFVLALLGAAFVPHLFGLGDAALSLAVVAALPLLVNWISSATAVTRLYDRFFPQALYLKVTAMAQLVGVGALWLSGVESVLPYLAVWGVSGVAGRLLFFALAAAEVRRRGLWRRDLLNARKLVSGHPELWRFVVTTNADGMVRVLRDLDIFLVNAFLGPAGAGVYRIARVLTGAMGKLTTPFYQAIYPQLANMLARGKVQEFARLMRQSAATLGGLVVGAWLGFVVVGRPLLAIVFGPEYTAAYGLAVWCLAAMVIVAFAQPLGPALMALGKVGEKFLVHLVSAGTYLVLLVAFLSAWGLIGAGVALFCFYALWCGLMFVITVVRFRKLPHETTGDDGRVHVHGP